MKEVQEVKSSLHFEGHREHGSSTVNIQCAFCGEITEAFIWSLSANGKKCQGQCKDTIHYRSGESHKRS